MTAKKKSVRKVVAKKVGSKKVKVTRAKTVEVSGAPVTELFSTQRETAPLIEVPANSVALFVNGSDKGIVDTGNQKFGDFVVAAANRQGIRSFTVYVDGQKADTSYKDKPMTGMHKVEIVTKDSRG